MSGCYYDIWHFHILSAAGDYCRPVIKIPPVLNNDSNQERNIKALKGIGLINHESTS